jgi:peptide/nickel transport system substrate-binding protein
MGRRENARRGIAVIAIGLAGLWMVLAFGNSAKSAEPTPTVLRATFASFPDYLDPQLSYTNEGWNAMYDTYIPLLTYRHAEGKAGSEVIPGLARTLPQISDGGTKYVLYLRQGLRYSNGRSVRASDFKYTVRRMFRLYSAGSPFFADIEHIATDDETGKIVIRLTRPRGTFTYELALPFVALVPAGTPMRDQSAHPPPATGPYAITSSEVGLGWTYERNPEWATHNAKLMPQLPGGHVDRIQVKVMRNPLAQVRAVEDGSVDWMQNPPPPALMAGIKRRYGGSQFRLEPTLSFYYFWMNTTKAPFNDVRVRRAVNYAIDARALKRIYAQQVVPTHQILPPGMSGYRRYDLYPHDMAEARRLIAKAKPRDREITVWGDDESPNEEATAYYAQVLRELGFRVHLKILSAGFYFWPISKPSTPNLDTGWSDWFEDYPHPNDFFQPLLSGSAISRSNSSNFTQIDVPSLNRRIADLRERPRVFEAGYAALDRDYMKRAPMVPYGTRVLSTFVSKRVDFDKVVWSSTFGDDLASFEFK